jgi:hypothetical protein
MTLEQIINDINVASFGGLFEILTRNSEVKYK